MIKFLLKGILRDRNRSLFPIIIVSSGVALTVVLSCWLSGILDDSLKMEANFSSGHVKVMTREYAKNAEQISNDLALLNADKLITELRSSYPEMDWVDRIRFGGLIDIPDKNDETLAQGPIIGWGIDLLNPNSKEKERFNIEKSIIRGRLPVNQFESLISEDFAQKFNMKIGDRFTLFSSTMYGSMAFKNFIVSGTVRFGSLALDRGAIIIDIRDARNVFNMEDAAGEILGYFNDGIYNNEKATSVVTAFNNKYKSDNDKYAPIMLRLKDQPGMNEYFDYVKFIEKFMLIIFILAMSVVLWNVGLLGGLRRYSEFGVRLALGEEKKQIYKTLIYESLMIGSIGSIIGTSIGLLPSYYLQNVGIDLSSIMQNSSLMMPTVFRASVTSSAFYVGFIPGLFSIVIGNALSGLYIYKRRTAQLFKELES